MKSTLRKCFLGILLGYGIILGGLFYWQVCVDLDKHQANPRYYQIFQQQRGTIFDRHGEPLAQSASAEEKYARKYAALSLSHVVGYFHPRYGMTGLERLYHGDLLSGRQLYTTIDLELQKFVEQALGDRIGAIVVLNPSTGEILALVSSPAVNGNTLDENWPDYLADLRSPFLNRATQGLYPPGSVIKPIVYGAALGEQLVKPQQSWVDQGFLSIQNRTISNYGKKALGAIDTDQALALSSNVVFAQLAIDLGDRLLDYFRRFGLGAVVGLELSNQKGFVPQRSISDYDAAQLGIGQGELLVTPLQMALVAATIANRGVMMRPFVVQELRGGLQMRQITRPQTVGQVLPEQIALILRDAMVLAVQAGTAQAGLKEGLYLAAKTGTAQNNQGLDHSWFIGFAPSNIPQVAVAVLVEHGGAGGAVAAPLGTMIMAEALQTGESKKGKR